MVANVNVTSYGGVLEFLGGVVLLDEFVTGWVRQGLFVGLEVRGGAVACLSSEVDLCDLLVIEDFLSGFAIGAPEAVLRSGWFAGVEHLAYWAVDLLGLHLDDVVVRVGTLFELVYWVVFVVFSWGFLSFASWELAWHWLLFALQK